MDADTALCGEDSLQALVECYLQRRGFLSVQPYHIVPRLQEKLSAYFNAIVMAGINAFTPLGRRLSPSGGFGPCAICSRKDYYDTAGHSGVRTAVMEDIALSKRFQSRGLPVSGFGGRKVMTYRMYPGSFREMIEGWSRSMASGAGGTRVFIFALIVVWLSGSTASFALAFSTRAFQGMPPYLVGPAIYLAYALQLHWMLRRIGSFGLATALLYPVSLLFFYITFVRSLYLTVFRKRISWRGRSVDLASGRRKGGREDGGGGESR